MSGAGTATNTYKSISRLFVEFMNMEVIHEYPDFKPGLLNLIHFAKYVSQNGVV